VGGAETSTSVSTSRRAWRKARAGSLVSPGSDHGDKIAAWLLYLAARFLRPPPERPLLSRRPGQVPQFLNTGVEA
jgi:hypothetical protein